MSLNPFVWEPDPAILAADLVELYDQPADAFRSLYLNEFAPPEVVYVSAKTFEDISRNARRHGYDIKRRTGRDGLSSLIIDGRELVAYAGGGGGSDDGGSDDDGTPPALRYRPTHGGRLPPSVSIH